MLKKLLPIGLSVALFTSACGSSDPPEPVPEEPAESTSTTVLDAVTEEPAESTSTTVLDAVTDASEGAPTHVEVPEAPPEPESVLPEPDETEQPFPEELELGASDPTLYPPIAEDEWPEQPLYDPEEDAEVFLRELVVWTLKSGSTDTTAQEASACYAESFTSALASDRAEQVAAELDQMSLWGGFPLDIMTDDERTQLFSEAAPCSALLYQDAGIVAALGMSAAPFLEDGVTIPPETLSVLEEGALSCSQALMEDENVTAQMLEASLFDSPAAQGATMAFLVETCGETFLVPFLVETFIAEEGVDRETAECLAPTLLDALLLVPVEMLGDNPDGFTGDMPTASDEDAEKAVMEMMMLMMAAFAECGYSPGF